MARLHAATVPPFGLGPISLILAIVGLMVLFLPVLAIPIAAVGLLAGLLGLGLASLRWSLAGIAVSVLVLVLASAIAAVPESQWTPRSLLSVRPPTTPTVATRPYVAPPARPNWWRAPAASDAAEPKSNAKQSNRE